MVDNSISHNESVRQGLIRSIYESGARLIPLSGHSKMPPRGWAWDKPVDIEFLARHPGGIAIFPSESGLLCLDVDYGHPDNICELAADFGIHYVRHKTSRPGGYHIWVRYAGGKLPKHWRYNGAGGDLIYRPTYAKIHNAAALVEIIDSYQRANIGDFLAYIGAKKERKKARQKRAAQKNFAPGPRGAFSTPGGRGGEAAGQPQTATATANREPQKPDIKANRLYISGYATSSGGGESDGLSNSYSQKAVLSLDYRKGNRSNQLNCDLWYMTLFGLDIEPAIAAARAAGFDDDDLAARVPYTIKAAKKHWFYRLRTGDFDPRGLSDMQRRVLTALASHADFGDIDGNRGGGNARPSQSTLAKIVDCNRETIRRAMKILTARGWLTRTGTWKVRKGPGIGIYQINVGKILQ